RMQLIQRERKCSTITMLFETAKKILFGTEITVSHKK
ncbi:unnamed protein product, partial [marine sediment metagenome]